MNADLPNIGKWRVGDVFLMFKKGVSPEIITPKSEKTEKEDTKSSNSIIIIVASHPFLGLEIDESSLLHTVIKKYPRCQIVATNNKLINVKEPAFIVMDERFSSMWSFKKLKKSKVVAALHLRESYWSEKWRMR